MNFEQLLEKFSEVRKTVEDFCKNNKISYNTIKYLDGGMQGEIYSINNKLVVKVLDTNKFKSDIKAYKSIMKHKYKTTNEINYIFEDKNRTFIIQKKLKQLKLQDEEIFSDIHSVVKSEVGGDYNIFDCDLDEIEEKYDSHFEEDGDAHFDFLREAQKELKSKFKFKDWHNENYMMNGSEFVIIDGLK